MEVTDSYLCGVFDGEGCVSVDIVSGGGKLRCRIGVRVSMCSREVVLAFHRRFGGQFRDNSKTRCGTPIFTWSVWASATIEALEVFSSGCIEKAEVSQIALGVARSMKQNKNRRALSPEEKKERVLAAERVSTINSAHLPPKKILAERERAYMSQTISKFDEGSVKALNGEVLQ